MMNTMVWYFSSSAFKTPFIFVILFWFGHNCWNSCFQKVIVEFLSTISLVCAGFCVLADPLCMKPSWCLKQASVHARSGCALVSLCLWLTYQEVNDGVAISAAGGGTSWWLAAGASRYASDILALCWWHSANRKGRFTIAHTIWNCNWPKSPVK